jgi:hypothetical protein
MLFLILALVLIALFTLRGRSPPGIPRAKPWLPIFGNAIAFNADAVGFLLSQRERLGDVVLVDLMVFKVVFFLGPEGSNAVLKGTDKGGISFLAAMKVIIGRPLQKGILLKE